MARKRRAGRRLVIRSKQQQRFMFGVLVKRGTMGIRAAKNRAKKGKAFKRLPKRKRR